MWYENNNGSYQPVIMVDIKCPVCKAILGSREAGDRKWVHCMECKCDFYFPPTIHDGRGIATNHLQTAQRSR